MVPTAWQDEALARDGVSREVPCSALKGEKEMATRSSVPAWRIPGTGEPGGLLSLGSSLELCIQMGISFLFSFAFSFSSFLSYL